VIFRRRLWLLLAVTPMLWGTRELTSSERADAHSSISPELSEGEAAACHERDAPAAAPGEGEAAPVARALPEPAPTRDQGPWVVTSIEAPEPPECEPTPLTAEELAEALREGHARRFGMAPHADRWACAWAQCAFEQARGDAIYAYNIGHVTAPSDSGQVCRRRFRERIARNPDRWEMRDVWFRVFESPAAGAEAYWRLLTGSYYSVLTRCDEADARGAARRLAELGYFTGPEEPYVDGMASLFVHARGALIPRIVAAAPASADK
jgi:hypothetical protein